MATEGDESARSDAPLPTLMILPGALTTDDNPGGAERRPSSAQSVRITSSFAIRPDSAPRLKRPALSTLTNATG